MNEAFKKKYGGGDYSAISFDMYYEGSPIQIIQSVSDFNNDSNNDYFDSILNALNGSYTFKKADGSWIYFRQITQ